MAFVRAKDLIPKTTEKPQAPARTGGFVRASDLLGPKPAVATPLPAPVATQPTPVPSQRIVAPTVAPISTFARPEPTIPAFTLPQPTARGPVAPALALPTITPTAPKAKFVRPTGKQTVPGLGGFEIPTFTEAQKVQATEARLAEREVETQRKEQLRQREQALQTELGELQKGIGFRADPARTQRQLELQAELQDVSAGLRPGLLGVAEGLSRQLPIPTTFTEAQQKRREAFGFEPSVAIEEAKETRAFKAASGVTQLAGNVILYQGINQALQGLGTASKLGQLLGGSKLAGFAGTQIADLAVDTIAQAPREFMEAVEEDKTLGQASKDFLISRSIDAGINLLIGGVSNRKQVDAWLGTFKKAQIDEAAERVAKDLNMDPGEVRGIASGLLPTEEQLARRQFGEVVEAVGQPTKAVSVEPGVATKQVADETEALVGASEEAMKIAPPIPEGALRERGFSRNIATDENMHDLARKSFDLEPDTYNVLSNVATLDAATKRFDQGFDSALADLKNSLQKKTFRPDDVPLAKMLANEAYSRGEVKEARRILEDIGQSLTDAGRYSQTAKILRESNDPVAVLDYIRKDLNILNGQGIKRYGKKWNNIELTEDELAIVSKFTGDFTDAEKEALFGELYNSISGRVPTFFREKLDGWRRMAMLLNPKTHIRNIVGNTIMAGAKTTADLIAEVGEKFIAKDLRTKSLRKSPEVIDIAKKYWEANKQNLSEGSRWEIFGVKSPFADKKIFNTGWLETLNDISKKTLEVEDIVFLRRHFTNDLAGFMQARGIKEPTQEAVDYALRRAQEATFRQANQLSDIISKGKSTRFGLLVEALIPFSKTPANIAKTGIDYSPFGLVKNLISAVYTKGADPAMLIEGLSKGLTGTALASLGYYMSENGLARGDYSGSRSEEALLQKTGAMPNSIKLPNGSSYTIDWAQPSAIPFFMGVAYQESLAEAAEGKDPEDVLISDKAGAFWDSIVAGGDTVVNMSMLQNVTDLLKGYGSPTQKVAELPIDYGLQGIPTVFGQVARVTDPVKRQKDYLNILRTTLQTAESKLPGASKLLPPKRDIYGQEQRYGSGLSNVFNQFLNPGYVAKPDTDPVTIELERVYKSEGKGFLPRQTVYSFSHNSQRYQMDNEEVSDFQQIMGEYTKKQLDQLINRASYKAAPTSKKAEMIKDINDEGYARAKRNLVESRGDDWRRTR